MEENQKLRNELCRFMAAVYSYRSFVNENFTGHDLMSQDRILAKAMTRASTAIKLGAIPYNKLP